MYGAEQSAQSVAGLSRQEPRQSNRLDVATNIVGNLCECAHGLANRLESLGSRVLGGGEIASERNGSSAPTPVRPAMSELEHRIDVLAQLLARAQKAASRLEDL